jgi:hypothetical protein
MKNTTHTPGPWEILGGNDPEFPSVVSPRFGEICDLENGLGGGRANARLIAAAPELLAALQSIIKAADDPDNERDSDFVADIDWEIIRAAIAKATGEGVA